MVVFKTLHIYKLPVNYISNFTDRLAISLSALCVMHCLLTPLLIVFLPSILAVQLENEAFHRALLLMVIPTSVFSLLVGCKKHKHYRLLNIGLVGILFLVSATFMEGLSNGELLEKVLTVIGACVLAVGHYLNFRMCNKQDECDCQSSK